MRVVASAFFNNGDGEFYSGAYSTGEFDASRGLAIDAEFSTPITRTQWQMISVITAGQRELRSDCDVGSQDRISARWTDARRPDCAFVYPKGEGPLARTRAAGADPLPSTLNGRPLELWRGAWHVLRVQLMPDGRCGYAIDGSAVAIQYYRC